MTVEAMASRHTGAEEQPRGRWAAYMASVGAVVYGLPHLWWGMGISATFPGDFQAATAAGDAGIGYWGFGVFSIIAAVGPLALVQRWGRIFPRWPVLIPSWTVSVALTFWGLGYFYMRYFLAVGRLQPTPRFAVQDADPQAVWGLLWYADFLMLGIALGVATWHYQRRTRTTRTP
ncbi:hypothetical protein [Streptosporangium sp. NPDC000396]|uniref:hypothetical protein n=1 Tax=Streptosporangium sp. NPDC000396 TaxID=3366185 RepID=UPI0036A54A65